MNNIIKINNIDNIDDINKIIKQPLYYNQCLINPNNYNKNNIIIHPLTNNFVFNTKCYTITRGNYYRYNINDNDSVNITGIYSYFHFPINQYNFTFHIYNITDINSFNNWLDDNIDNITLLSINRLLYSISFSFYKYIKNNKELFINIIKKILKKFDIDINNKNLDNIIMSIIKDLNDNNTNSINKNNYIDIIKKYLNK